MPNEHHPIEGLMQTAMESIKSIVDVNTILGDPVESPDGSVVVPVSRVSLGFAAGGTEYEASQSGGKSQSGQSGQGSTNSFPFGGGSGAGISVNPVAFLVVGRDQVRLLPVDNNVIFDRLIDLAPHLFDKIKGMTNGKQRPPVSDPVI